VRWYGNYNGTPLDARRRDLWRRASGLVRALLLAALLVGHRQLISFVLAHQRSGETGVDNRVDAVSILAQLGKIVVRGEVSGGRGG
jgi:hypothetical protein